MTTSWYDITALGGGSGMTSDVCNQQEIQQSIGIATDLLMKEVEKLGTAERVFIGGFSQGCAISVATFLQFKQGQLGGVVGLSGAHCT